MSAIVFDPTKMERGRLYVFVLAGVEAYALKDGDGNVGVYGTDRDDLEYRWVSNGGEVNMNPVDLAEWRK